MNSFDCCLQLLILQALPGGGSSVFNRSTIDYTDVDESMQISFANSYREALKTVADLLEAAPAGADGASYSGQLGIYFSDGTKQEQAFSSLNFAGAQTLMHAGIDLLAALANLPYRANGQAVLAKSGVKHTLPVSARGKLKNVKMLLLPAALLLLSPLWARAQFVSPWHWTKIDAEEYALWHNGNQAGNYRLSDESYYPRLAPGRWGPPAPCPCVLHPMIEVAQGEYRRTHWKTRGVLMGKPKQKKSEQGLRYHNLPMPKETKPPQGELPDEPKRQRGKCDCPDCPPDCNCGCTPPSPRRLSDDTEKIPDYSAMPSLTLVARDEADARAALEMFERAPELAAWRDKYGGRAKAYSLAEFRHTSSAFKLDQDRQFQESGFVALVQPQAPDADGKAAVRSYYAWATPQQALRALRDADPHYDPNPKPSPPAAPIALDAAPWGKVVAGAGLGGSTLLMFLGALAAALRSILH